MKRTGKRGVDVVIEHVGGDFLGKSIKCLTRGGRVVTVGGTKSYQCEIEVNYVFHKELSLIGSNSATKLDLEAMMPLLGSGKLKAVIDRVFPLQEAVQAHVYLRVGKTVRQGIATRRALTTSGMDKAKCEILSPLLHRARSL